MGSAQAKHLSVVEVELGLAGAGGFRRQVVLELGDG